MLFKMIVTAAQEIESLKRKAWTNMSVWNNGRIWADKRIWINIRTWTEGDKKGPYNVLTFQSLTFNISWAKLWVLWIQMLTRLSWIVHQLYAPPTALMVMLLGSCASWKGSIRPMAGSFQALLLGRSNGLLRGRGYPVCVAAGGAIASLGDVGQVFWPPVLQLFFSAVTFHMFSQRTWVRVPLGTPHHFTFVGFLHGKTFKWK